MVLTTAALCLATNLFHEARSEPIMGQYAVALVTLNRAGGDKRRVCDVVLARKQFSWTTSMVRGKRVLPKGLPRNKDAWRRAQIIANVALSGRMIDITKGSTFYHTTAVHPHWSGGLVRTRVIGHHIFYRQNEYVISDLLTKGEKV